MNILDCSLEQLTRKLRALEVSAESLMEACAANYAASEPGLNAYKTWNGTRALEAARHVDGLLALGYDPGPLAGIPVSVKDMYAVPGMPTFAGSPADLGPEWQVAGPLVQSLAGQLALVTGKTHTVEFALGGIGTNAHWGTPRNPWSPDVHRVPGGSSSGAGVSLCQGSALLAMGTDTGGSVRIPAAMTGTVGFKPSGGHWPTQQIVPLSTSLDSPGILTRTAVDAAFAYAAIESRLHGAEVQIPDRADCRGLRIGVVENFFWEDAPADLVNCVEQALGRLEAAGAVLIPVRVPDCDAMFALFQQGGLSVAELAAFLSSRMPERLALLDPVVRSRIEDGGAVSAREYLQRKEAVATAAANAAQLLQHVDVWAHPTLPITAPTVVELEDLDTYRRYNMLALRNPAMANLMGLAALSLPVGLDSLGLPVGIQLTATAGSEHRLLGIGCAVERVLGPLPKMPA